MMRRWNLFLLVMIFLSAVGCTEKRQTALLEEAEELSSQNQFGESVEVLRKAVALNPESKTAIRAIYRLGYTLETQLRDYDGALLNYAEFIRLSPDRVGVYEVQKRIASILFEHKQDSEKAISAYRKLLSFSPDSLEADFFQLRVAQGFFHQNNFEQARIEFQSLLERHPKSQYAARVRYDIANSYFMEGKYDVAVEAAKQLLRIHPQGEFTLEAQFLIAQCFEHEDRFKEALEAYQALEGRYSPREVLSIRIESLKKRLRNQR